MRRTACALALTCALAGCAARSVDVEAAVGHLARDVQVVDVDRRTFVTGRLKDDVPPGLAGLVPWEGQWRPFVAEFDQDQRVRWIRELSVFDTIPRVLRAAGGLWLVIDDGKHETIERIEATGYDRRRYRAPCRARYCGDD